MWSHKHTSNANLEHPLPYSQTCVKSYVELFEMDVVLVGVALLCISLHPLIFMYVHMLMCACPCIYLSVCACVCLCVCV